MYEVAAASSLSVLETRKDHLRNLSCESAAVKHHLRLTPDTKKTYQLQAGGGENVL